MKRLLFDVPRWHLYLHREARGLPAAGPEDGPLRQLEDELFEVLYSGEGPPADEPTRPDARRDWAKAVHGALSALPSFQRLARQCRADAGSTAVAVETLLEELQPKLPEAPRLPEAAQLRRAAGKGCTEALGAVAEAQELAQGLQHVGAGTSTEAGQAGDGAGALRLLGRLRKDSRLRRIAELAGRFKRILAEKRRQRVHHGADEVVDVEQGAELARLLPSELARIRHPKLRLAFLRDFVEKQCLQYRMAGVEALGKGPLVVCLDKSGSMAGAKDVWATAVTLALLDVAQHEKRPFGLICFNGGVTFEASVRAGEQLSHEALFVSCDGGTDIDAAVARALDLIEAGAHGMRRADVVLVTDGISDPNRAAALRIRAGAHGVTILGFGIDVSPADLAPWCDSAQAVTSTEMLEAGAADGLAAL
jgi:uncharacterized protein with von Willebrand factor type A (vWA) domain